MYGLWNIILEWFDLIWYSCVRLFYDIYDNSLFNKINLSEFWMKMNLYIELK